MRVRLVYFNGRLNVREARGHTESRGHKNRGVRP